MERYWSSRYRSVPVFYGSLKEDMLGEYQCTPLGINDITLADNQGLSDKELLGVLLHEMCHHVVFETHGIDVEPHGDEWKIEMEKVGFIDPDEYTDGINFFSDQELKEIFVAAQKLKNEEEARDKEESN